MAIMLRRPETEMNRAIPRRFTDMMDEFVNEALNWTPNREGFVPATDILEDNKYYYLNVYLPGMTKDQISVDVAGRELTISGEREWQYDSDKENWDYHLIEGHYGRFERSFTLPQHVDTEKIEARFEHGILKLHVPKTEERTGKQIEIK